MKKNTKKSVLETLCEQYDLSLNCLNVEIEFVQHLSSDYRALVVQHPESDTCYLIIWTDYDKPQIKEYNDMFNEKRLIDLYEFMTA